MESELGCDIRDTAGDNLPWGLPSSRGPSLGRERPVANANPKRLPGVARDTGNGLFGDTSRAAIPIGKGGCRRRRAARPSDTRVVKNHAIAAAGVAKLPLVAANHVSMLTIHVTGDKNDVVITRRGGTWKAGFVGKFHVGGSRDVRDDLGILVRGAGGVRAIIQSRRASLGTNSPGRSSPGPTRCCPTRRNRREGEIIDQLGRSVAWLHHQGPGDGITQLVS